MEQIILNAIMQHIQDNQVDDQVQSAWVYKRQVLLHKRDLCLGQGGPCVR